MMKYFIFSVLLFFCVESIYALPAGFIYLKQVDSSIQQDIRYAGNHNFVGRPIKGYRRATCILTLPAAQALAKVQAELKSLRLSLKVYDCYRPQMAVNDFFQWSKKINDIRMKAEFYPNVNKADFFKLGYVAEKSGHTRGSTMDVALVSLPLKSSRSYHSGEKLVSCIAPYSKRFRDNSIDMGTGFDCMDPHSFPANRQVSQAAYENRVRLKNIMQKYGFVPYDKEWWHFTLKNEPFPNHYSNFPVE